MLSAAQLLDELMGRDRDLAPDKKRTDVPWDHDSVCKFYLCAFCPAELFTNTRSDLGPCEKIHDEALRKQYEESSRYLRMGYERDFMRYLQGLLVEVERRIRRGHARVALFQSQQDDDDGPGPASGPVPGRNEEKVQALTQKIDKLLEHIEALGSEGKVEEAQDVAKRVERLKGEIEYLRSTPSAMELIAAQEKPMEVCEICGAFLIVGDKQARVDDHFMGKRHLGYARIKATIAELRDKLRRRSEEPERENRLKKDKDRDEKERGRGDDKKRRRGEEEKENGSKKARDRDRRERSGSRGRRSSRPADERGGGSREPRRSRSRERRRSRSRERRRSRERMEKKRRSRSRERRPKSLDRKSNTNRSPSRESEKEMQAKEEETQLSEENRSRRSASREKLSEVTNSEPLEGGTINEVANGTGDDTKSEGEIESDEN
ncbi:hypothetical protein NDU88_010615 [Pleurodeles waltl]|uniref:Luc7-like protein 3 n=1 Tax=Pleurodeles waltl TaxID=8319 RepID=A0AAV7PZE4_PLEWA|nr:hypothetical protein NDU88_010615 [Pleurodeles waltl]